MVTIYPDVNLTYNEWINYIREQIIKLEKNDPLPSHKRTQESKTASILQR